MTKAQYELFRDEIKNTFGDPVYEDRMPQNESARRLDELKMTFMNSARAEAHARAKERGQDARPEGLQEISKSVENKYTRVKLDPVFCTPEDIILFTDQEKDI